MNYSEVLRGIRERGEKVLVVGLGISGIESTKFLCRAGIKSIAVERQSEEDYRASSKFRDKIDELKSQGAELQFGVDGEKVTKYLSGVSLCVLSPGVSLESSVCGALRRHNIPLLSELELGIELFRRPAIVVTGSNGKSTTVNLIHAMLKEGGKDSTLCGNIGIPVIGYLDGAVLDNPPASADAWLVVEASSYQLETCSVLKPKIALLLNISENHLERHGTLDRYLRIKAKIFERQTKEDLAVLCSDDKALTAVLNLIKAELAFFGETEPPGIKHFSSIVYDKLNGKDEIILKTGAAVETFIPARSKLRGRHNRLNIAAAVIVARRCGVKREAIEKALDGFIPLEHRIEACREKDGVLYINDSKSTTVAASVAAFQSTADEYPERKITVMFGGLSKAGSWDPLMKALMDKKNRLGRIICFGKDGPLIARNCKSHDLPCEISQNLSSAVQTAASTAKPGDVVLLTPGCASFDEFSDFEERGNVFKSLVAGV